MRFIKAWGAVIVSAWLCVGTALAQDNAEAMAARAEIKGMFGFVPMFLQKVPDVALPGAWEEMKSLQMNPSTTLDGKTKELIGLAVAAQIPCKYCVYAHTEFAKLNGATDEEIAEAVMISALTRHWSTFLQGEQTDFAIWKNDVASWLAYGKKIAMGQAPAPTPMKVSDAKSAFADVQQNFGSVPDMIKKFPPQAVAGAWREERDLELNPKTALSGKVKGLIGLAVAAQIPCRFCIAADTEFARAEGVTDAELSEAIAMSALTRHWSTFLNGMQIDERGFNKDVEKLVGAAKKMMKGQAQTSTAMPAHGAMPHGATAHADTAHESMTMEGKPRASMTMAKAQKPSVAMH